MCTLFQTQEVVFAHEIVELFDSYPELLQYKNESAMYDDVYYAVPLKELSRLFQSDQESIGVLNMKIQPYEGSINTFGETVCLFGGA